MVVQLATNLLGDREEALDLSQDVFLRVFSTIHRFRGQSSLRTWIYRIAVNQARNRHRFWRRRHRADQVSLDRTRGDARRLPDVVTSATPDGVLAQKELAVRLHDALDHLPFDQRTAIVLREIDGLSYEEIAFSLGVAIGTVKSRLTRARKTLREELGEARIDMKSLTCAATRRRLDAFHDRELSVPDQIAVSAHLDWCDECAAMLRRNARGRRGAAFGARPDAPSRRWTRRHWFRMAVVSRLKAEHDASLTARVRMVFDDCIWSTSG